MQDQLKCPRCAHSISSSDENCPNCKTNLAIAAVLAENAMFKQFAEPAAATLSPEILVPKLGDYLVDNSLYLHLGNLGAKYPSCKFQLHDLGYLLRSRRIVAIYPVQNLSQEALQSQSLLGPIAKIPLPKETTLKMTLTMSLFYIPKSFFSHTGTPVKYTWHFTGQAGNTEKRKDKGSDQGSESLLWINPKRGD